MTAEKLAVQWEMEQHKESRKARRQRHVPMEFIISRMLELPMSSVVEGGRSPTSH
jgi:hypothetical protein